MIEHSVEEKIIDRAQKKLYLDAAVVQQGRLQESSKALSKEEMLSMIRFGADAVFNSKGGVTDEDIDVLIARGEERSKADNARFKEHANSLANFSLGGEEKSLYEFEGQDWSGVEAPGVPFAVSLPKRSTGHKTYDENEYYRNALTGGKEKGERGGPKLPKQFVSFDFQFYDVVNLEVLRAKEIKHYEYKRALARRADGLEDDAVALPPQPGLTKEEEAEKDALMAQGFGNWNKRDFNNFINACTNWGRHDLPKVAKEVEGKTDQEVAKYAAVFFKRFREIKNWESHLRKIDKGEQLLQRKTEIANALNKKVSRTKNPWVQLRIDYGSASSRGKQFSEENDRFLVCMTNHLGYGRWDELREEVRSAWIFRFDWFLRTRTTEELKRRVDTLARLIEKEISEAEAAEAEEQRKKGKKGPSSASKKRPAEESGGSTAKKKK
uniref:SANT domain-containing protein n=1 Tax=Haptolina ericina TaxID=156174 RepID=A0A7S3EZ92_9EUKA